MNPIKTKNRRLLLILSLSAFFLLIIGLFIFRPGAKEQPADNRYADPFSHETVSDPPGKSADDFGIPSSSPIFLGFGSFLDHGMTDEQLSALKEAFYKYSKNSSSPIREISINVDNVVNKRDKSGTFYLLFQVRFDRRNVLTGKVDYTGLSVVRLYLIDPSANKVVFDSGPTKAKLYSIPEE